MTNINGLCKSVSKVVNTVFTKSGHVDFEQVSSAADILNKGGVIAVPTDTIYGLAAKAANSKALNRIYKIKERNLEKPLAVCVSKIEEVEEIAETKSLHPLTLSSLLPGPVTLLLKRKANLNPELNSGLETVGVRIPDHNFIIALSAIVGPLALTSANRSGESSPLVVSDFEELWPELDCVFDCGLLHNHIDLNLDGDKKLRAGSTVIDLTVAKKYTIIREGCSLLRTINTLNRLGYRKVKTQQ